MLKHFMIEKVKDPVSYNGNMVTAIEAEIIQIEKVGDEYKIVPPDIDSEDMIADSHIILLPTTDNLLDTLQEVLKQEDPIIELEMDNFVSYAEVNYADEYIAMNIHKSLYDFMQDDIDNWDQQHN
jgi:hypothetical protein